MEAVQKSYNEIIDLFVRGTTPTQILAFRPQTLARARQLAASRHCTVEALLKECLERLGVAEAAGDPFLGMCADEPAGPK